MDRNESRIYEFENFRLDARNLLLYRGEKRLAIRPKIVETLLALVERGGQVLHKDELMKIVWADSVVEEGNLSQNLYLLRKALGVSRNGVPFIETLHRRGYRFSPEVRIVDYPREETFSSYIGKNGNGNGNGDAKIATKVVAKAEPIGNVDSVARAVDLASGSPSVRRRGALIIAAITAIALGGSATVFFRSGASFRSGSGGETTFVRLTNGGDINDATISPDGKYFVYHDADGTTSHMWLQQTGTASRSEVIPPTTMSIASKTFSPDGQNIYFIASEKPSPVGSLYRVSTRGGVQTKITDNAGLVVAVSPDSGRIAFLRDQTDRNHTELIVADNDGGNERTLMTSSENHVVWGGLAWSPDGRSIAYGEIDRADPTLGGACTVSAVDPESGAMRVLSPEKWDTCGRMAWTADGRGLMFIGTKEKESLTSGRDQLFYLSIDSGVSRLLTGNANRNQVASLGVTNDNSVLVVPYNRSSQLWVMDSNGNANTAKQITSGLADGRAGIAPLPGGRIAYIARTGTSLNIWTVSPDGSEARQITTEPQLMEELRASPDGKYLYYSSPVNGSPTLFRCEPDGSNQQQALSDASFALDSSIAPNGRLIAYNSAITKDKEIVVSLRIATEDGEETVQLTNGSSYTPHFSPDGHLISYIASDDSLNVVSVPDGRSVARFTAVKLPVLNVGARWTPAGDALTYIVRQKAVGNIWVQPLDGSAPRPLTNFTSGDITNYAFSSDGASLIIARGYPIKDATLIKVE